MTDGERSRGIFFDRISDEEKGWMVPCGAYCLPVGTVLGILEAVRVRVS